MSTVAVRSWLTGFGAAPIWPAATWAFWAVMAALMSSVGEVQADHLVRVDPDAQGALGGKELGAADTIDAAQLADDVAGEIIAERRLRRACRRWRSATMNIRKPELASSTLMPCERTVCGQAGFDAARWRSARRSEAWSMIGAGAEGGVDR